MSQTYIISILLSALILLGIRLMSSPKTAVTGNRLSALSMLAAVLLVLYQNKILTFPVIWLAMAAGGLIGYLVAVKVTMIKMPQMVALLNGLGGGASALVALVEVMERFAQMDVLTRGSSQLALLVGGVTLSGSLVAALKLEGRINQRPVTIPYYGLVFWLLVIAMAVMGALSSAQALPGAHVLFSIIILLLSLLLGIIFAMRVGGADMPITISLLNACSGLAAAITGFTIAEPLLVAIGAIVGASGLILTQIMCRAMNRTLLGVLQGSTVKPCAPKAPAFTPGTDQVQASFSPVEKLKSAQSVIIVPGYGMAVAQAQTHVKKIADLLEQNGATVKFAIHPVAGRMPGHMNVLLAEADVPYDKLYEMGEINPAFKDTDLVLVVGASDVINPAANTAEGTPIYGMPVLNVAEARHVIVCNLDKRPGYSGVENALYDLPHVAFLPGNAAVTLDRLAAELMADTCLEADTSAPVSLLKEAKSVIIVPGYGMAVAQAQTHVKKIADLLEQNGAAVKFAIHPVAGRMPGHMNVLLAEADVPYDKLYEMGEINPAFKDTDLALVVGASDVINPAANTAEGTPIYGMPVLNVAEARHVIVCNLDKRPGYSGVENALYDLPHVIFLPGNAAVTLDRLAAELIATI